MDHSPASGLKPTGLAWRLDHYGGCGREKLGHGGVVRGPTAEALLRERWFRPASRYGPSP